MHNVGVRKSLEVRVLFLATLESLLFHCEVKVIAPSPVKLQSKSP